MRVFKCDKCGAEYMVGAPVSIEWGGLVSLSKKYDLCIDCKDALRKWVNDNGK